MLGSSGLARCCGQPLRTTAFRAHSAPWTSSASQETKRTRHLLNPKTPEPIDESRVKISSTRKFGSSQGSCGKTLREPVDRLRAVRFQGVKPFLVCGSWSSELQRCELHSFDFRVLGEVELMSSWLEASCATSDPTFVFI